MLIAVLIVIVCFCVCYVIDKCEKRKRKRLSRPNTQLVYDRCEGRCFYCDKDVQPCEKRKGRWELDHMHAFARNGADTVDNQVVACFACNKSKSSKTVQDFLLAKPTLTPRCFRLVQDNTLNRQIYCRERVRVATQSFCHLHQIWSFDHFVIPLSMISHSDDTNCAIKSFDYRIDLQNGINTRESK